MAADGVQNPPANPSALAVPHLDLRRAGWLVALGFESIPESSPPDLVIIFGTGHSLYELTVAVTSKSFETPLVSLESDREAVERFLESTGDDARAEEILRNVQKAARTGRIGDGKILVLPAMEVERPVVSEGD